MLQSLTQAKMISGVPNLDKCGAPQEEHGQKWGVLPEAFSHAAKPADNCRRCERGNDVPRSKADGPHDATFRFCLGQY